MLSFVLKAKDVCCTCLFHLLVLVQTCPIFFECASSVQSLVLSLLILSCHRLSYVVLCFKGKRCLLRSLSYLVIACYVLSWVLQGKRYLQIYFHKTQNNKRQSKTKYDKEEQDQNPSCTCAEITFLSVKPRTRQDKL